MKETIRNQYVDFLKGTLIYLVILGHFVQVYGKPPYEGNWLHNLIYTFHMPLFLAISGFFCYKSHQKYTIWAFLKKRTFNLLIPLLIWDIFMTVVDYNTNENFLLKYLHKINSCYWYIWSIIFYSVFICLFNRILLRCKTLFVRNLFLLSSILLVMSIPIHSFNFPVIKSMYPFFIIGYIFSSLNFLKIITLSKRILPLIVLIALLCFIKWSSKDYVFTNPSSFNNISIVLFRFVSGCSISIVFLFITFFLFLKFRNKLFINYTSEIGTKTLGIYLFQELFFTTVQIYDVSVFGYWINILSIFPSILILCISYYIVKGFELNRILAFFFLGEKLKGPYF